MNWLIIIGIGVIISFIGRYVFLFFWELKKDKADLEIQPLCEKFKLIVDMLNISAFNGGGKVVPVDKTAFNLYEDGQNQLIYFIYSTGNLTIIWKFKYYHQEVVFEKTFRYVRNINALGQQKIAREVINEMDQISAKHKNKVLTSMGLGISNSKPTTEPTFTDHRDGNVYKTIKIGNQIWLAENLRFIPSISPPKEEGGIWVYDYDGYNVKKAATTKNYKKYGCLYSRDTAISVCPDGWHLSTNDEWTELTEYLGGRHLAGAELKSIAGWGKSDTESTNGSGFSALPGGYRNYRGSFKDIGSIGYWWSATDAISFHGLDRDGYFNSDVLGDTGNENEGFSIRCVKDY